MHPRHRLALVIVACALSFAFARSAAAQGDTYRQFTAMEDAGRYQEAEALGYQTYNSLHNSGQELPAAQWAHNLGILYKEQQRLDDAATWFLASLRVRERLLSADSPDVAYTLGQMGAVRHNQERYEESSTYHERSLAARQSHFGARDKSVALSLNQLGDVRRHLKDYAEAERLLRRGQEIRESLFGTDSADTAWSYHELGRLYDDMKRYGEAEALFTRTLRIRESAPGKDQEDLFWTLWNLGNVFTAQGKFSEADPLYKRALAIREPVKGAEHADVVLAAERYADMLRKAKRDDDAAAIENRYPRLHVNRAINRLQNGKADAGDAAQAYLAAKGFRDPDAAAVALVGFFGFKMGGNETAAGKLLSEAAAKCDASAWPYPIVSHLQGKTTAQALYQQAGDDTAKMADVQSFLGLSAAATGEASTAKTHWDWALENGDVKAIARRAAVARLRPDGNFAAVARTKVELADPNVKPAEFTVDSKDGRFATTFPGKASTARQVISGITNHAFTHETSDGGAFVVSYFDLPNGVNLTLDTAASAYVTSRKGTVTSEKRLALDEYPGKEVVSTLPGGKQSRLRLYNVGQRQYQVIVEGPGDTITSPAAEKFLGSFKLSE